MPIYEYTAQDGTKIELIRPMADADKPVTDPEGKGRTFTRVMSTFASGGGGAQVGGGGGHVHSGMCGCGKRKGSCGGA
ncbi:MAG TPA: hypothetical protein VEB22_11655 [Phycisphaerales bacterium]|nr:hypothetical protein [Phycisphaerales bacterium]